jgi:hypothetical protein
MAKCPGQDQRFWKLDDIFEVQCPGCGAAIEFWKDEPSLKCLKCQKLVVNPRLDLGCAEWCQYAAECLGAVRDKEDVLCKRLIRELKERFDRDQGRLDRTLRVFRNAQQILEVEGGDGRVVSATALLHDVEEASAVREVLLKCEVDSEATERITGIIRSYRNEDFEDSIESRILWDAIHLANLDRDVAGRDGRLPSEPVEGVFKTQRGLELATRTLAGIPGDRME